MATDKQVTGGRGEKLARTFLEQKGFRFITANWASKTGEIDLIMKAPENPPPTPPLSGREDSPPDKGEREGVLVFVEVRTRKPTQFGLGYETVAGQKQKKLIRTAKYYMQKEDYWDDARFDVVSIIDDGESEPKIEHIPWAFGE